MRAQNVRQHDASFLPSQTPVYEPSTGASRIGSLTVNILHEVHDKNRNIDLTQPTQASHISRRCGTVHRHACALVERLRYILLSDHYCANTHACALAHGEDPKTRLYLLSGPNTNGAERTAVPKEKKMASNPRGSIHLELNLLNCAAFFSLPEWLLVRSKRAHSLRHPTRPWLLATAVCSFRQNILLKSPRTPPRCTYNACAQQSILPCPRRLCACWPGTTGFT